jgi:hypothetical protein
MIDYTAFGDVTMKFKPGMFDPGTITVTGHYDPTDSTGQQELIRAMTSGRAIGNSCTGVTDLSTYIKHLRLWENDDTSFESYGWWSCTGSSGRVYITGVDLATNKDGLGTITFSMKVSEGAMAFTTST